MEMSLNFRRILYAMMATAILINVINPHTAGGFTLISGVVTWFILQCN
jgi:hypothetical protein